MIIRQVRPGEEAAVGELRVAAYRALGTLSEGSDYAQTLRGFGFADGCVVLVAAGEAAGEILGTITLEPFGPHSELAQDETEADARAFAVAPHGQGRGVGRNLLIALVEYAEKRGLRRLRLCTQPAMQAAQHIYETTGFSRTPDLDFQPVPGLTLHAYELALPRLRDLGSHRAASPFPTPSCTDTAAPRHQHTAATPCEALPQPWHRHPQATRAQLALVAIGEFRLT